MKDFQTARNLEETNLIIFLQQWASRKQAACSQRLWGDQRGRGTFGGDSVIYLGLGTLRTFFEQIQIVEHFFEQCPLDHFGLIKGNEEHLEDSLLLGCQK